MRVGTNVYPALSCVTQSFVALYCATHFLVTVLFSSCLNLKLEGASGSCNAKVNPLDIKVRQDLNVNVIFHSCTPELAENGGYCVTLLIVSIKHSGVFSFTVYN